MKWPVLIAKPHNVQSQTDERVSCWVMKAFQRKIAEYYPIGTKLPEFGRNKAIQEFLTNYLHRDKTHIFFLDADTEPVNPHAIERLMSLDKDVVCGVTPVKLGTDDTFQLGWNVQRKTEDSHENYDIDELPKEPFRIDRVGGTTVLVKRHVLETLAKKHKIFQKCEYNEDMTNIKLSEDYYFSQLLTDEGFEIWCDPLSECHHYHIVDLLDMIAVYRQAYQMGKDDND
jgi:hypothetical protein